MSVGYFDLGVDFAGRARSYNDWTEYLVSNHSGTNNNQENVSKIRVRLSRPLFWAEREAFGEFLSVEMFEEGLSEGDYRWSYQTPRGKPPHLNVKAAFIDSRSLFEIVQSILGEEFTNVYVKAVKTSQEVK